MRNRADRRREKTMDRQESPMKVEGRYAGLRERELAPSRSLLPGRQLRLQARARPEAVAIRCDGQELTYAAFDALADRFAAGLLASGLVPGDAFGIRLPNCPEYLALVVASARAGLVHTAINLRLAAPEVEFMVSEGGLALVVGEDDLPPAALLAAAGPAAEAPDVPVEEGLAFHLRYSSGTTGRQKVSMSTQRTVGLFNELLGRELSLGEDDVQLVVAPLTHMAGSLALAQLAAGGTVVILPRFDAETLWRDCDVHGVTNLAVVPTMIANALDADGSGATVRTLVSMGAPLAISLKERLAARLPALGLFEMYGSSEMGMVTCLRPAEQLRKPASVGRARFGYEVLVADEHGTALAPGEVGDVYARGPMVHSGYVGVARPADPPAALAAGGWLTVGDLGFLDEDGFLHLSVRRSDLILSGGFNVYPAEVEQAIVAVDGVREVSVVGLEDERWGQRVVACVVGTASEEAILAACRAQLAGYKQPRQVAYVDELPKSPNGKVLVRAVRERLAGLAARP
jgi:long-chain acyl-CoA synthetase